MCSRYVPGVSGGQKRALEPLKLELQRFVSLHVGTGKQTSGTCPDGSEVQPSPLQITDVGLMRD